MQQHEERERAKQKVDEKLKQSVPVSRHPNV